MVRILTDSGKSLGMFPNRLMARHEHDTATLKDHDAVVLGREYAFRRLKIEGIVRRCRRCDDEGITDDIASGELRQLVFVPRILVVKRKLRWAMRRRNAQEVGLLKSPDLRIQ